MLLGSVPRRRRRKLASSAANPSFWRASSSGASREWCCPVAHLEVAVVREPVPVPVPVPVPGLERYKFSWIATSDRAASFDPSPWMR
jgi:hypothetical protein